MVRAAFGEVDFGPAAGEADGPSQITRDDAVLALVQGWTECTGPFTPARLAETLCLPDSDVGYALARLEADGAVLRGEFSGNDGGQEFCDRRILARIHRSTVTSLRPRSSLSRRQHLYVSSPSGSTPTSPAGYRARAVCWL